VTVAVLSVDDLARMFANRTFQRPEVAVAIVLAESGGRTDVIRFNAGPPPSRDRGLWQINDRFHPTVSDAQALDPTFATEYAFLISRGGTNYAPWNVFRNGAYTAHLPAATAAVARQGRPAWWRDWTFKPKPTVRAFSRHGAVSYLQSVLSTRAAQPNLTVNGIFDGATDAAVKNIQRFFGLTVDGIVGRQTWPVIDFLAAF
jgi:hypothetical protein